MEVSPFCPTLKEILIPGGMVFKKLFIILGGLGATSSYRESCTFTLSAGFPHVVFIVDRQSSYLISLFLILFERAIDAYHGIVSAMILFLFSTW